MNKTRRQQLRKWLEEMEETKGELESICSDEQENDDNIPENLERSERATETEAAINQMNEAVSSIEDVICIIEDIV